MRFLTSLLLAAVLAPGLAGAQTYPDKSVPIKIIVPFGPGSSADALGRAVARGLAEVSGVTVIVENRAGADGLIGIEAAKLSRPDGYTMLLTTNSTQVVNPHLYKKLPYDPISDFVPLAGVARVPMMMNVGPHIPFKTVREFVAAMRANPGKYTIASATSTTRVAGEMLKSAAGVDILAVPFKNFSDAFTDVVAGRIDMVIVDAATAGPFYQTGVRPMATTIAYRSARFPEVPTLQEEGIAGYDAGGWYAAFFPDKTPQAIVDTMRDHLSKALKTSYVTDVYTTAGMEPLNVAPQDMDKFQRAEFERWGAAVRAANLPKQ